MLHKEGLIEIFAVLCKDYLLWTTYSKDPDLH